jgi:hypothetical protein
LHLCKEYGGTITNVHSSEGDIEDHYQLKFDSEYINDEVDYENFDFMSIVKSDKGDFADSVMNEAFGFFRMLWRVRGGFEMTLNFNAELDHRDFVFAMVPDTHTYDAVLNFKIDDDGNYVTKCDFKFVNLYKDVVTMDGFEHTFEDSGKWVESTKTKAKKVFYIKSEFGNSNVLPLESCFSSISVTERFMLLRTAKQLAPNSVVIEVNSGLGGRASILARGNNYLNVHSIEAFNEGSLLTEFESVKPWIREQLFDTCTANGVDKKMGQELLEGLTQDFENDPSGKLAWKRITNKCANITLHERSTPRFIDWTTPVDLVLINMHTNPAFVKNLNFWIEHLKDGGCIMAHLYDENLGPDVYKEINNLISQGWKVVNKEDTIILIQKP